MKENLGSSPIVNPLKYPSVECDNCGGKLFHEEFILKKIPGVIAGTGSGDMTYPVPTLVCSKCGTIEKSTRELIEKGDKYQEKEKEKGGLIL